MTELMHASGTKIDHATLKHAQTIRMVGRTLQKLEQILKLNVTADTQQQEHYVNIAVMAHNTTYNQSIKCTPTEIFHGRVPHNVPDLNFSNPPQTLSCKTTLVDEVNQKIKENVSRHLTRTRTIPTEKPKLNRSK